MVLFLILFVIFIYVLESSFLIYLPLKGFRVDLLLLFVISYSFTQNRERGAFVGFCVGLLQDLAMGNFFGINIFSKMLIGFTCGTFSACVFRDLFFLPIWASALATSVQYLLYIVFMLLLGYRFDWFLHVEHIFLPMLFFNMLFSFPMQYMINLLRKYLERDKYKV